MKINLNRVLKGTVGFAAALGMSVVGVDVTRAQDVPQPPRIEQAERTDQDVNQDVGRRPDDGASYSDRNGDWNRRGQYGGQGRVLRRYGGNYGPAYQGQSYSGGYSGYGGQQMSGHGSCGSYGGARHHASSSYGHQQYGHHQQYGQRRYQQPIQSGQVYEQRRSVARDVHREDENPNRPVLGVRIRNVDQGVNVTTVRPQSPAMRAGLQTGDRIIRINGQDVGRTDDVLSRLRSAKQSDEISLVVERDGQQKELSSRLTTYGQAFGTRQDIAGRQSSDGEQGRRELLRPNLNDERSANDAPPAPAEAANDQADDLDLPEAPSEATDAETDQEDADNAEADNSAPESAKNAATPNNKQRKKGAKAKGKSAADSQQ